MTGSKAGDTTERTSRTRRFTFFLLDRSFRRVRPVVFPAVAVAVTATRPSPAPRQLRALLAFAPPHDPLAPARPARPPRPHVRPHRLPLRDAGRARAPRAVIRRAGRRRPHRRPVLLSRGAHAHAHGARRRASAPPRHQR